MSVSIDPTFVVDPGLSFRLENQPERLRRRIAAFLGFFADREDPDFDPIRITADPPPRGASAVGPPLVDAPPIEIRRAGEVIFFEAPGVSGWCQASRGRGGLTIEDPPGSLLDHFLQRAFGAMLFELACARGWLGFHAAAVAAGGHGILLPGKSGAGKSTICRHARRFGLDVLSDDLVWLRPAAKAFRLYAFPHGPADPPPAADDMRLEAIVCPEIVERPDSRLRLLGLPGALDVLAEQSGFLTSGPAAGERFLVLVRLAGSVPGYRLEAGNVRVGVPALLERLVEDEKAR